MNLIKLNRRGSPQLGFSLIEVLIGIAIAGVGIVGVIELQKLYMQSTSQANARVIAMKLATEKLEDTKSIEYKDLEASDTGESDNITHKVATFARKWKISNRYYVDGTWQTGTTGLDPVPTKPDAKAINVTVSWNDSNGDEQYVNQSKYISKTNGIYESSLEDLTLGGGAPPKVDFHSLGDLENPSISLLDPDATDRTDILSKETSKPEPKVSQRGNLHRVQFETVVYDSINDTQTLEDFATVNCDCAFTSNGDGKAPTTLKLDDGRLINDPDSGQEIAKEKGTDSNSGIEPLCTKCCAGHHDDVDAKARYSTNGTDNHSHYVIGNERASLSGSYNEACRFKRIDGFYELVPDWVLVDFIILPQSFFTDRTNGIANSEAYTAYVKRIIKAYILGQSFDPITKPTRVTDNVPAGASQLIARGIYIDLASLSQTDIDTIKSEISTNIKWLELVPFYDVNLTLFAQWHSSNTNIATVTSEPIKTIVNVDEYYYGTYSRGRLLSQTDGTSNITASINIDNTGITGTQSIIPTIARASDTFELTVNTNADSGSTGDKSITIEVECTKEVTKGQKTEVASCHKNDLDVDTVLISVLPSNSPLECTFIPQHPNTSFISCTNIPDNWSGSVAITKDGYSSESAESTFDTVNSKFIFGEGGYDLEAEGQSTPTFQVHLKNY